MAINYKNIQEIVTAFALAGLLTVLPGCGGIETGITTRY